MTHRLTIATLSLCCLVAAVGLCVLATGCAYTTGSVQGVVVHDSDGGYDTGLGVSADAVTKGKVAVAARATVTNAEKRNADTGYTYAGSIGARIGQRYFGEVGQVWYGYESQFADGNCAERSRPARPGCTPDTVWAKDRSTWYAATGVTLPSWQGVLRYYPSNGDNYDVTEWALESRHYLGRWLVVLEPSVYGITVQGERRTGTTLRGGVGVRW